HPELLQELRTRFQHVLLDEYQDTNVAQRRLMQRICPPGASIMAVGDARQAIYAFRGATMYNLLSFTDHFPATPQGAPAPPVPATPDQAAGGPPLTLVPDPPATAGPAGAAPPAHETPPPPPPPGAPPPAQERPPAPAGDPLPLSTNFRSGPRILALANSIIDRIPEERRGGASLGARAGAAAGEGRGALLADQFAEAAFVADQIVRAHEAGLPDGTWPAWRDVAVLVRSQRLAGPLRGGLEQRGGAGGVV